MPLRLVGAAMSATIAKAHGASPESAARRVEIVRAARDDRDARAFARERLRARVADALARAGDDDDAVFESEVHGLPRSAKRAS